MEIKRLTEEDKEAIRKFIRVCFNRLVFIKDTTFIVDSTTYNKWRDIRKHSVSIGGDIPLLPDQDNISMNLQDIIEIMRLEYHNCCDEAYDKAIKMKDK